MSQNEKELEEAAIAYSRRWAEPVRERIPVLQRLDTASAMTYTCPCIFSWATGFLRVVGVESQPRMPMDGGRFSPGRPATGATKPCGATAATIALLAAAYSTRCAIGA
jgi:hypothetical protein